MSDSPERSGGVPTAVAESIREACIAEAILAWEQAGISGLCHDGRFEAAVGAMRRLDLAALDSTTARD